jgi:hypothetical protein
VTSPRPRRPRHPPSPWRISCLTNQPPKTATRPDRAGGRAWLLLEAFFKTAGTAVGLGILANKLDEILTILAEELLAPARTNTALEVRDLPGHLRLELHAGDHPALVLTQGENAVRIELAQSHHIIAALTDAATDLGELLAVGGVYHD